MTDVAAASPPTRGSSEHGAVSDAPIAKRAAARLLDFAVGVAVFVALVVVIGAAVGPSPDGTGVVVVAIVAAFLVYVLYEVILVGVWGRTLGKQLLGLQVIGDRDGGRPGLRRALLRNLVPTLVLIGFFPLYPVPYLLAAVAKDHRWPNDRLAGTRVVSRAR